MATIQSIAKAKTTGLVLKNLFGVEPQYEYFNDYVKLSYSKDVLPQVHERINTIAVNSNKPSDVRIDFVPMIAPIGIKKVLPYAIGAVALGYVLGKVL